MSFRKDGNTLSSFKLSLRKCTTIENFGDAQSIEGLCLSMEEITSTEPCLADQLEDEAEFKSSSSSSES